MQRERRDEKEEWGLLDRGVDGGKEHDGIGEERQNGKEVVERKMREEA